MRISCKLFEKQEIVFKKGQGYAACDFKQNEETKYLLWHILFENFTTGKLIFPHYLTHRE